MAAESQLQTEIELSLNEEVHIVLCSASKSNLLGRIVRVHRCFSCAAEASRCVGMQLTACDGD